jgi:hypothetical protein
MVLLEVRIIPALPTATKFPLANVMAVSSLVTPDVRACQALPLVETKIVPAWPTQTYF